MIKNKEYKIWKRISNDEEKPIQKECNTEINVELKPDLTSIPILGFITYK